MLWMKAVRFDRLERDECKAYTDILQSEHIFVVVCQKRRGFFTLTSYMSPPWSAKGERTITIENATRNSHRVEGIA